MRKRRPLGPEVIFACCSLFAVIAVGSVVSLAQTDQELAAMAKSQNLAVVKLVSRSFPYDLIDSADQEEKYRFELVSANGFVEIPFVERQVIKSNDGLAEHHKDIYRVFVPEEIYRVSIPDSRDFRLAGFFAKAGEIHTIYLPVFRFAVALECFDGKRVWQMDSPHFSEKRSDRGNKGRTSGLFTTISEISGGLDIVFRYCESSLDGSRMVFKSAEAYFNNQFVGGDEIVYDRNKQILTVKGSKNLPAYFQDQDGKEREGKSLVISVKP